MALTNKFRGGSEIIDKISMWQETVNIVISVPQMYEYKFAEASFEFVWDRCQVGGYLKGVGRTIERGLHW